MLDVAAPPELIDTSDGCRLVIAAGKDGLFVCAGQGDAATAVQDAGHDNSKCRCAAQAARDALLRGYGWRGGMDRPGLFTADERVLW